MEDALDGGGSADGHEYGGEYRTVVGDDFARSRRARRVLVLQREFHIVQNYEKILNISPRPAEIDAEYGAHDAPACPERAAPAPDTKGETPMRHLPVSALFSVYSDQAYLKVDSSETVSFLRPFARRAARTLRPLAVAIL